MRPQVRLVLTFPLSRLLLSVASDLQRPKSPDFHRSKPGPSPPPASAPRKADAKRKSPDSPEPISSEPKRAKVDSKSPQQKPLPLPSVQKVESKKPVPTALPKAKKAFSHSNPVEKAPVASFFSSDAPKKASTQQPKPKAKPADSVDKLFAALLGGKKKK